MCGKNSPRMSATFYVTYQLEVLLETVQLYAYAYRAGKQSMRRKRYLAKRDLQRTLLCSVLRILFVSDQSELNL